MAPRIALAVWVALELLGAGTALGAPGDLDPAFGSGGTVITAAGLAYALAVQPDGRIVTVGGAGPSGPFAVDRYHPDGRLDESFGLGGHVTTEFDPYDDYLTAVAIQPDGGIVAAGYNTKVGHRGYTVCYIFFCWYEPPEPWGPAFVLVRYRPDGSLDSSFGVQGRTADTFGREGGRASALALQADGKIVVAGLLGSGGFAVARYGQDGGLDEGFGQGGVVILDLGGGASAVAVQPDGRIVAVGTATQASSRGTILVRYGPDGSLDPGFGTGGVVAGGAGSLTSAWDLAVQPGGSIVVAGEMGGCWVSQRVRRPWRVTRPRAAWIPRSVSPGWRS